MCSPLLVSTPPTWLSFFRDGFLAQVRQCAASESPRMILCAGYLPLMLIINWTILKWSYQMSLARGDGRGAGVVAFSVLLSMIIGIVNGNRIFSRKHILPIDSKAVRQFPVETSS